MMNKLAGIAGLMIMLLSTGQLHAGPRAYVTHHEGFTASPAAAHQLMSHASEMAIDTIYAVALRAGCTYFSSPTMARFSGNKSCTAYPYLGEMIQRGALQQIRVVPWLEWSLIVPADSELLSGSEPLPTLGREKIHHGVPTRYLDIRSPLVLEYLAGVFIDVYQVLGSREVHLDDNFAPPKNSGVSAAEMTSFLRKLLRRVRAEVPEFSISLSSHAYRFAREHYAIDWPRWRREGLVKEVSVQLFHKRPDLQREQSTSAWRRDFTNAARLERQQGASSAGIYAGTKAGWRVGDLQPQHQILTSLGMDSITFTLTALIKKAGGLGREAASRQTLAELFGEESRGVPHYCQFMETWNGQLAAPAYAEADDADDAVLGQLPPRTPVYRELTDIWAADSVRMRVRLAETDATVWLNAEHLRPRPRLSAAERDQPGCAAPLYPYNESPFDSRLNNRIAAVQRAAEIPVLMYHDVVASDADLLVSADVTIANFRKQLDWLQAEGYTALTATQYYSHVVLGEAVPEKAVLITFDDGYIGNYTLAAPALLERQMPAVFFVHTAFVGVMTAKDHVDFDELRQMASYDIFSIQSHTVKHLKLSELSPEKLHA